MKVNIIIAIDSNFVIGNNNNLPWPKDEYKEDLKHFRHITSHVQEGKINYLICGFRTYQNIKNIKLGKRRLVVINRNAVGINYHDEKGSIHVKTLEDAFKICELKQQDGECNKVFIIGGKKSIEQTLALYKHKIDTIYLTQIKKSYPGNVKLKRELFTDLKLVKCKKIRNMHFCEYIPIVQQHPEQQYLNIIREILNEGIDCDDRTGVGIKSIFGTQSKYDLSQGIPLLTTKKMFTRGITEELLWFLRGETDAKILQKKGVHIWDGNTTREFLDKVGLERLPEGDIGETYGFLFRHFGAKYQNCYTDYTNKGFDQVEYVLNEIRNNPNSRRIIMSLWKPPFWGNACLPPCLFIYHFRVYGNKLNCSIYQRSGDIGLGVPFNIASASLMTYLFCHLTGLTPGKLVHTIADNHIYNNHSELMKQQIKRKPLPFPKLKIKDRGQTKVEDFLASDFEILGYMSYPRIKMDMAV